jgi:hypothetical protein
MPGGATEDPAGSGCGLAAERGVMEGKEEALVGGLGSQG